MEGNEDVRLPLDPEDERIALTSSDSDIVYDANNKGNEEELLPVSVLPADDSDGNNSTVSDYVERYTEIIRGILDSGVVQDAVRDVIYEEVPGLVSALSAVDSEPYSLQVVPVEPIINSIEDLADRSAPVVVEQIQADSQEDDIEEELLEDNALGSSDSVDYQELVFSVLMEIKEQLNDRPLLETSFSDFSVIEGLLLILVLWIVVLKPCLEMLRSGFSWLN